MSENKSIALSELAAAIRAKQDAERRYEDIFLSRIDDIEFCLEHERYMAALALALTLPDICGKAEFPSKHTSVTERYIKWFNQFVEPYGKPTSKYSDDIYGIHFCIVEIRMLRNTKSRKSNAKRISLCCC